MSCDALRCDSGGLSSLQLDSYLESDLMGSLEALRTAQPDTNKTLRDDFDALHYLVGGKPHAQT